MKKTLLCPLASVEGSAPDSHCPQQNWRCSSPHRGPVTVTRTCLPLTCDINWCDTLLPIHIQHGVVIHCCHCSDLVLFRGGALLAKDKWQWFRPACFQHVKDTAATVVTWSFLEIELSSQGSSDSDSDLLAFNMWWILMWHNFNMGYTLLPLSYIEMELSSPGTNDSDSDLPAYLWHTLATDGTLS